MHCLRGASVCTKLPQSQVQLSNFTGLWGLGLCSHRSTCELVEVPKLPQNSLWVMTFTPSSESPNSITPFYLEVAFTSSGAQGLELNIHVSVMWGVWPLCHRSVSRWPEPALPQTASLSSDSLYQLCHLSLLHSAALLRFHESRFAYSRFEAPHPPATLG